MCLKGPFCPQKANQYRRTADEPESFYPSKMALRFSSPAMRGFRELKVDSPYTGNKKILVLGTSSHLLPMDNGKYFNTGHHTTETFVPLYHFDKCGFEFDFATEDGRELQVEQWTIPLAVGYEDKLKEAMSKLQDQYQAPMRYEDVEESLDSYAAVFIPGGHGPLINMMSNAALGKILRQAHAKALPTISLCHGPAGFVSAAIGGTFPYKGYKMCVFPDKTDDSSPKFGYLPGHIDDKRRLEAALKSLGMQVQNTELDDSVYVDRELVTGTSQMAAQNVAEAAVKVLADKYGFAAS